MPRFTLIEFDRYVASRSKVSYHNTSTTDLKQAFKEALANLWEEEIQAFEWSTSKISVSHFGKLVFARNTKKQVGEWSQINQFEEDKIGIDFEEHSYLFFES